MQTTTIRLENDLHKKMEREAGTVDRLTRQHIEAVGSLIAERHIEPEKARDINREHGWQYDVGAPRNTLADRVRYNHVRLSDEEMDLAIKFADDVSAAPARFIAAKWWHENTPYPRATTAEQIAHAMDIGRTWARWDRESADGRDLDDLIQEHDHTVHHYDESRPGTWTAYVFADGSAIIDCDEGWCTDKDHIEQGGEVFWQ